MKAKKFIINGEEHSFGSSPIEDPGICRIQKEGGVWTVTEGSIKDGTIAIISGYPGGDNIVVDGVTYTFVYPHPNSIYTTGIIRLNITQNYNVIFTMEYNESVE